MKDEKYEIVLYFDGEGVLIEYLDDLFYDLAVGLFVSAEKLVFVFDKNKLIDNVYVFDVGCKVLCSVFVVVGFELEVGNVGNKMFIGVWVGFKLNCDIKVVIIDLFGLGL